MGVTFLGGARKISLIWSALAARGAANAHKTHLCTVYVLAAFWPRSARVLRAFCCLPAFIASRCAWGNSGRKKAASLQWHCYMKGPPIVIRLGPYAWSTNSLPIAKGRPIVIRLGPYAWSTNSLPIAKGRPIVIRLGPYAWSTNSLPIAKGRPIVIRLGPYAWSTNSLPIAKGRPIVIRLGPYAWSTNSLPIANGTLSPYLLTLAYRYVNAIVPLTSLLVLHAYGPRGTRRHTTST